MTQPAEHFNPARLNIFDSSTESSALPVQRSETFNFVDSASGGRSSSVHALQNHCNPAVPREPFVVRPSKTEITQGSPLTQSYAESCAFVDSGDVHSLKLKFTDVSQKLTKERAQNQVLSKQRAELADELDACR